MLSLLLATALFQQPVPAPSCGEDPHAPEGFSCFGEGLADIGDIDGDGLDDFTISDPMGSVPATIWVISGRKGWVIEELCSEDTSRTFGRSISALPDVDGDGIGEILVGLAPDRDESAPGRAAIYSGRTRVLLRTLDAAAGVRGFGTRVAGLGDLDGDGAGDVLVTADEHGTEGFGFVYSGRTGRLRFAIQVPAGVEARRIDPVGDVDADGIADLAFVGSITRVHSPFLRLLSGVDGHLIDEVDTEIPSQGVGLRTLAIEDQDSDGLSDLLFCSRGVLQVRSATNLRLLRAIDTPNPVAADCPRGLARVGDIDGDGVQDLVLGDPEDLPSAGAATALSVRTGKVLWNFAPHASWRNVEMSNMGRELVTIGDCNRDGVREFIWAPDNARNGSPGVVFVSSGKTGRLLRVFARGPRLGLLCLGPRG